PGTLRGVSSSARAEVTTGTVLVVDDDADVRDSLARSLDYEGYAVLTAPDGRVALDVVGREHPDVVVLDVQMPVLDGLETCRRLRATGDDTPVILLTARTMLGDRVTGLDAGADDYLVKPFALEELLARVRAQRRRASGHRRPPELLEVGDLQLDLGTREVHRSGTPISLTRTEFDLLALLMRHPRQVLTRAQLVRDIWGFDHDPASNSLEVYIGYLRRKTEIDGRPRLVQTVRGVGYAIRAG
ncbi:MAG: response regulator transcription factor, partial [Dermatophilaceae bacterium]